MESIVEKNYFLHYSFNVQIDIFKSPESLEFNASTSTYSSHVKWKKFFLKNHTFFKTGIIDIIDKKTVFHVYYIDSVVKKFHETQIMQKPCISNLIWDEIPGFNCSSSNHHKSF